MELKADEVLQKLHAGEAPSLLLIVGEEPYYRTKLEKAFYQSVYGEVSDPFGLSIFSGAPAMEEVRQCLGSYAFDGLDNFIIVRDCQWFHSKKGALTEQAANEKEKNRQMAALLTNIPANSHVLLLTDQADKRTSLFKTCRENGWVTESQPLKSYEATAWLSQELQAQGLKLTTDARAFVEERMSTVEQVSCSLLKMEIEKWRLFLQGRRQITRADLELVFGQLPETSSFRLLDALGERRLSDAFQLLRQQFKNGADAMTMAGLLAFYLRRLLQTKQLRTGREVASAFHLPAFLGERLLKQASGFKTADLETALAALGDWNAAVRRGGVQGVGLEDILLQLMIPGQK